MSRSTDLKDQNQKSSFDDFRYPPIELKMEDYIGEYFETKELFFSKYALPEKELSSLSYKDKIKRIDDLETSWLNNEIWERDPNEPTDYLSEYLVSALYAAQNDCLTESMIENVIGMDMQYKDGEIAKWYQGKELETIRKDIDYCLSKIPKRKLNNARTRVKKILQEMNNNE